jgi:CRISPR-associated exonuclease Cas4
VQLCAQALCLEEMLGVEVPRGAIFHASSKRRREVEFTPQLREATFQGVRRLHELIRKAHIPPAVLKPQCEGCSLKGICMPELSQRTGMVRTASRSLFDAE